MGRIKWMLLGIIIGAAVCYGAAKNYLVRTSQGFEVVPKASLSFGDSYVDARGFDFADWSAHPELVKDITVSGKMHILQPQLFPSSQTPSSPKPATMWNSR